MTMTITSSTMNVHLSDTIIVALTDKEWYYCSIKVYYKLLPANLIVLEIKFRDLMKYLKGEDFRIFLRAS